VWCSLHRRCAKHSLRSAILEGTVTNAGGRRANACHCVHCSIDGWLYDILAEQQSDRQLEYRSVRMYSGPLHYDHGRRRHRVDRYAQHLGGGISQDRLRDARLVFEIARLVSDFFATAISVVTSGRRAEVEGWKRLPCWRVLEQRSGTMRTDRRVTLEDG